MNIDLAQVLTIPGTDNTLEGPLTNINGEENPVFGASGVTLGGVITNALFTIFGLAALALLLMLVLGGFKMLTSTGDPKKIDSGKQQITYAIVGFIVVALTFWIVQILATIFGLQSILTVFQ